MRVAYLVNHYPAVSHTFIRREIRALERQGVEVERFALRGWDSELVDPRDRDELEKTRHTLKDGLPRLLLGALKCLVLRPGRFWKALKLALSMSKNGARPWPFHLVYLAHACRIVQWLEASGASHLHAHFGTNSAEIAALVQALGGPTFSFTAHGSEVFDDPKAQALEQKTTHAKFVAASCAYIASQLMYNVPPDLWHKIRVVHCGLPEDAFAPKAAPLPEQPVFLSVGRLSSEKGHLVLLEAFSTVLKAHPTARLVLAGDGPLRPLVEGRIDDLGLGAAVEITGWISSDEVRERIRGCRVLVHPSFTEGLPVVIMEAMAQRRPVISTYIAGIPELVRPGETGWLVPAGRARALAEAMTESASLPAEALQALGDAGHDRVRIRHDADVGATRLRALFCGERPDEICR